MMPSNYNYSNNDPRVHNCANCEHRWVAFHLVTGTSFCNLHKLRTRSSAFHSCDQWVQDSREKPTWTQNVSMAFHMPDMDTADFITSYTLENSCPSCKNCEKIGDMYYCNKYFEELNSQNRTCKMCEVDLFGKCDFLEEGEIK